MFEVITQKIGFPEEAAQYFEQCYIALEKAPKAMQSLNEAKELLCKSGATGYVSLMEQAAQEAGVHVYGANMVMLLLAALSLKEKYEKAGFEEGFYYDNIQDLTNKLTECKNMSGLWGTWSLDWETKLFRMERFKFGRLHFQKGVCVLREPYKGIVQEGDRILECHIPGCGPLDIEEVKVGFKQAYEFYKKDFPEGNVILTCRSWLLYTPLISKLPETSNIRKFSEQFDIVQLDPDEENKNFWRVFQLYWPQDIHTLTGKNTLQRIVLEHIKNGGNMGIGYGVIVLKDFEKKGW